MTAREQHATDEPPTEVAHHTAGQAEAHGAHETHGGGHGADSAEEPSAAWGWHGEFPKVTAIAGWITAASMFLMLIGNHENWVEDIYLVVIGVLLVGMLIGGWWSRRSGKR